jgi:hypothetical protein
MKTPVLTILLLSISSACTAVQRGSVYPPSTGTDALVREPVRSSYFSINENTIPAEHWVTVAAALKIIEQTLPDEAFLNHIRAKSDWTFLSPPATAAGVVVSIQRRVSVENGAAVHPRLAFYKPAAWGEDVCGGWHWGPIYQTSATGCTSKDGTIWRNELRMQDAPDMAEFLVHEWMHAAGFQHGDNDDQETREKRNSVPIHVACLAVSFPDLTEMTRCSEALRAEPSGVPAE